MELACLTGWLVGWLVSDVVWCGVGPAVVNGEWTEVVCSCAYDLGGSFLYWTIAIDGHGRPLLAIAPCARSLD